MVSELWVAHGEIDLSIVHHPGSCQIGRLVGFVLIDRALVLVQSRRGRLHAARVVVGFVEIVGVFVQNAQGQISFLGGFGFQVVVTQDRQHSPGSLPRSARSTPAGGAAQGQLDQQDWIGILQCVLFKYLRKKN